MIPFERNKYFYGKLLTVRDFDIEQRYFNDKRRLLNRLSMGPGILAGLNCLIVDDKTILVEPGVALDYLGREIVVDSPFTSRLSVIEGFEDLGDYAEAYLCIVYQEEEQEAVHNVASTGQNGEDHSAFNRIKEGYALKLTATKPNLQHDLTELLWKKSYTLAEIDGISIFLQLEQMASVKEGFDLKLTIERQKEGPAAFVEVVLNSSFIHYGQDMVLTFDETQMESAKTYSLEYHFDVSQVSPQDDLLGLKTMSLRLGETPVKLELKPIKHKVLVSELPRSKVISKCFREMPLDELLEASAKDEVCIARLRVLRTEKTYVVESVETDPFDQLIHSYGLGKILNALNKPKSLGDKLPISRGERVKHLVGAEVEKAEETVDEKVHSSGKILFDFKTKVSAKDKFFSVETPHNLGSGEVFISLAIDSQTRDGESNYGYQNQLVFGDYDIFEKSSFEPAVPLVKTGAIVYKNKGSFVVGVQFLESYSKDDLTICWKATKVNRKYDSLTKSDSQLMIEPSMSKIKTKTKQSFNVFLEGRPIVCQWQVKDENGGEIDQNGVYMSPSIEGVYEIVAKYPELQEEISAFVIVENH